MIQSFTVFLLSLFVFTQPLSAQEIYPFRSGEEIEYDIIKFRMKVGSASLKYHGEIKLDGQEALLIYFTATAPKFFDQEKIYLDPLTFKPIRVDRDLDIFGKQEQISEFYSQDNGLVRIVKKSKGETSTQMIEKKQRLDNIYGFLYKIRAGKDFSSKQGYQLNLPTTEVTVTFKEKIALKVADQKFHAYYLESVPKQYKIWFDQGAQKIPLRIEGALGSLNASLVMSKYRDRGQAILSAP